VLVTMACGVAGVYGAGACQNAHGNDGEGACQNAHPGEGARTWTRAVAVAAGNAH